MCAVAVSLGACKEKIIPTPDPDPIEIIEEKCEYPNCECVDCAGDCECGEEILPPERYPEQPRVAGFYDLETAYFNGWLSVTDLKNIAYYYHGEKSDDPDFVPTPKEPAELDALTIIEMKTIYFDWLISTFNYDDLGLVLDFERIMVDAYMGTYDDCIIATAYSTYIFIDPAFPLADCYIGGVLYKKYWTMFARVFILKGETNEK